MQLNFNGVISCKILMAEILIMKEHKVLKAFIWISVYWRNYCWNILHLYHFSLFTNYDKSNYKYMHMHIHKYILTCVYARSCMHHMCAHKHTLVGVN